MRFIDLSKLTIAPEKLKALQEAFCEVKDLPPAERNKAISARASVWQALKDDLAAYSRKKCWYCESIQVRSDDAVDHFRPKNAVRGCIGHNGYWWLAFDWRNYRYACTFCNSRRHDDETDETGGKGDYFPLVNEECRVYDPGSDIDLEEPALLDPVRPRDPKALWFDETGRVVERFSTSEDLRRHKKAETSISLYNLNHSWLRERRQILFNDISEAIRRADRAFRRLRSGDDKDTEDRFDEIMGKLLSMTREGAEYSAAARAYLRGFRNSELRPWLDELLEE
jgi:uncharacterized protein (TIGR02646 family)